MKVLSYTSREEIEVHRFSAFVAIGIPLVALILQAYIPVRFPWFSIFDLPLLVTIFFAVARRNPITGLLTGALLGLAQDSLTHQPLGLYGIAKTIVGYVASQVGVKIDVENPGSRLGLTFGFFLLHQFAYFLVARQLATLKMEWSWGHVLLGAFFNAALSVILFFVLDRFKQRR